MQPPEAANQPPDLSAALKLVSEGCRTIAEGCELLTAALAAEGEKRKDASSATTSMHAPGRIAYRPSEMPALLGISRSVYYKAVRRGLIKWTRIYDGGPKLHLTEHVDEFRLYLSRRTVKREKL